MASDGERKVGRLSIGSLVRFSADKYPEFPYSDRVGEVARVLARGRCVVVKFDGCDCQFVVSIDEIEPVLTLD